MEGPLLFCLPASAEVSSSNQRALCLTNVKIGAPSRRPEPLWHAAFAIVVAVIVLMKVIREGRVVSFDEVPYLDMAP